MSAPEVGKRYRIEATVEVVHVEGAPPLATRQVIVNMHDTFGHPTSRHFVFGEDAITWTEVEPEYVVGALYVDAMGDLCERIEPREGGCVWRSFGADPTIYRDVFMERPLTRLYREGERP